MLRRPLNEDDAIVRIYLKLELLGLLDRLTPQIGVMLRENRRDPASRSAIDRGHDRGNRAEYGIIPCCSAKGKKALYDRIDLDNWMTSLLIPKLELMED